jgi:hypothetical protein
MKTTNQNNAMDIIRYAIAGAGILGIVVAITVFELAK